MTKLVRQDSPLITSDCADRLRAANHGMVPAAPSAFVRRQIKNKRHRDAGWRPEAIDQSSPHTVTVGWNHLLTRSNRHKVEAYFGLIPFRVSQCKCVSDLGHSPKRRQRQAVFEGFDPRLIEIWSWCR